MNANQQTMPQQGLGLQTGSNGETATFAGAYHEPGVSVYPPSTRNRVDNVNINLVHTRLVQPHMMARNFTSMNEVVAKTLAGTQNSAERMSAFTTVCSMVLAAATKLIIADKFVESMSKHGHTMALSEFIGPKQPTIDGVTVNIPDVLKVSQKQTNGLLNNVRECMNIMFATNENTLTAHSRKAIANLMSKFEAKVNDPTAMMGLMFNQLMNPNTQSLTSRLNAAYIADNTKIVTESMQKENTPAPRLG